jgi:hypothetical protein
MYTLLWVVVMSFDIVPSTVHPVEAVWRTAHNPEGRPPKQMMGSLHFANNGKRTMQRRIFSIVFAALLIALAGCTTASTNSPSPDADTIATAFAGTLSAISSPTLAVTPTVSLAPAVATPTTSTIRTYVDPDYGFMLQYDLSWNLNVEARSPFYYYDGRGRWIRLNKGDYYFDLAIADGPIDPEDCGGFFDDNPAEQFWKYSIDDVEVWRLKAEQGYFMSDEGVAWINIISPLELYPEPIVYEHFEDWGNFTCNLNISHYGVSIKYVFPENSSSEEIFAEMDEILRSLTWKK